MASYNRYENFTENGKIKTVPFIEIERKSSDKYIYYELGITRLDIVSYDFYKDSNYDWLIMQANPELPPYEFMIPNGTRIRIPYPLEETIIQYEKAIETYNKLYKSSK